ncbi:MAG: glutathione synthetase [Methylobacter sp.]|uniref:SemiSWEET transporter n=1 Tax=Methylovulum miyakonense TaxID=645578 RepID=UPI00038120FD|nr:SemiSWEET transporter [Methylovulum miyakonense]PPD50595.1 MAG: glutathione synthetase [Methylobacter sp.]
MTITPDIIGYIAATLTTSSFLPQAILTIKTRDTESLSMGMYSLFTTGVFCWLVYGVYIADKALVIANIVTFILAATILSFKVYNDFLKKK